MYHLVYGSNNIVSGEFRPARKVERLSDCLEDRLGEIAVAREDAAFPYLDKKTPWSFTGT